MDFVESDVVELKAEVVSNVCKEIIAFANSKGGTLHIGVSDDGQVVGVKNADQVMLQINNMVRDSIKPDVTMFVGYEAKTIGDKKIVTVTVQQGTDRPYYLGSKGLKPSGVYVRNGTSTDPATDAAIRKMIQETDGDSFENRRSLEQTLTFKAATEQFLQRNMPFDSAKMQSMGLISPDGIYSNAAWLLSDQCTCTVKAATFAGLNRSNFQNRREFTGSLFQQMEDLYAYLDLRNSLRSTIKGLYRHDKRDYPEDALREAMLNALIHRDYSVSASTLVSVFDDRIEFVNAGGLLNDYKLDDIMVGLSVCRNPKLAAVFYRLQLIEVYGTGLAKIMEAYDGSGLTPKIEVTPNVFKITLPNCNVTSNMVNEAVTAYRSGEEKVLSLAMSKGYVVRSEVEELLGVSQATANRLLKRLIAEGELHQESQGRTTRYRKL